MKIILLLVAVLVLLLAIEAPAIEGKFFAGEAFDHVERLTMIHGQTREADTVARSIGARALEEVGEQATAATLALTRKLIGRAALSLGQRSPVANCTVSHLPGPEQPLYLCGARMTYVSAILPIVDGMGLVFAVTVYDGRVVVSPTSCRELMPQPEDFAQAIRDSFQEMLALGRNHAARKVKPLRAAPSPAGRPSRKSRTG